MKSRKRLSLLALLLVVAMVAAACGGGKGDKKTESKGSTGTSGGAKQLQNGPGFDGTTITLGVITPQTGPAAVIGNPLTAGNQVFFDALNAKGGIAGKYKVKLDIRDSQYNPPVAVQAYSAMKGNVVMFVQILGTPTVKAILPQLNTDKIAAGPASLDAFWVREKYLIPIGGPYQIQAINGMDYYMNEGGGKGKKVCALTQDDPYGEAGLEGLEFAAKEMNFTLASKATFKQGDADFTAQLGQLKGAACDAVWLTALPTETAKILGGAAQQNWTPQWIAQSPTWVSAFAASPLAPYMKAHYFLMSEGTEWGDTTVPGMKQMLDDIQKFKADQKPDIYFAFGYAEAWAAAQVLEQAVKDGDLSRDGIEKAMEDVGTLSFGGLLGDYKYGAPADRVPPKKSTVFSIDPAAPGGLKALKKNFTSDAAGKFEFKS